MRKSICLIVIVILLSIPTFSMAKPMYITERVDNMLGKTLHTLHVPSTDELSEITIEIGNEEIGNESPITMDFERGEITVKDVGNESLITMSFKSSKPADCKPGYYTNISFYYTNISFGFDAEEKFTIPFYCPDLQGNFVYSFAPSNAKGIMHHMKNFDVLYVRFYHNDKVITFDLKDFRSVYNIVHLYNRLSNSK